MKQNKFVNYKNTFIDKINTSTRKILSYILIKKTNKQKWTQIIRISNKLTFTNILNLIVHRIHFVNNKILQIHEQELARLIKAQAQVIVADLLQTYLAK